MIDPVYNFVDGGAKEAVTPANGLYKLFIRQQPNRARACTNKERDRRPVDPPVIVQLKVTNYSDPEQNYLQSPYLFMFASLYDPVRDSPHTHLPQQVSAGTLVSSLHRLKDIDNSDGGFFVFGDLSVKIEGDYRLKLSLFEVVQREVVYIDCVLSDVFTVYSTKAFPGMSNSTFLSRSFSDQGVRIRVRKELRMQSKRMAASSRAPSELADGIEGEARDGVPNEQSKPSSPINVKRPRIESNIGGYHTGSETNPASSSAPPQMVSAGHTRDLLTSKEVTRTHFPHPAYPSERMIHIPLEQVRGTSDRSFPYLSGSNYPFKQSLPVTSSFTPQHLLPGSRAPDPQHLQSPWAEHRFNLPPPGTRDDLSQRSQIQSGHDIAGYRSAPPPPPPSRLPFQRSSFSDSPTGSLATHSLTMQQEPYTSQRMPSENAIAGIANTSYLPVSARNYGLGSTDDLLLRVAHRPQSDARSSPSFRASQPSFVQREPSLDTHSVPESSNILPPPFLRPPPNGSSVQLAPLRIPPSDRIRPTASDAPKSELPYDPTSTNNPENQG